MKTLKAIGLSIIPILSMGFAQAGTFDLSQTPMEVPQGTIANAVIILDDSASMEAEVITTGYDNDGMMLYDQPFKVTAPSDIELAGGSPTGDGFERGSWLTNEIAVTGTVATPTVASGDELSLDGTPITFTGGGLDSIVADINAKPIADVVASKSLGSTLVLTKTGSSFNIQDGALLPSLSKIGIVAGSYGGNIIAADTEWRFRNSSFNPLYYDPEEIYEPWPGLSTVWNDSDGKFVPYSGLAEYLQGTRSSPTAALYGIDDVTRPENLINLLNTGAKQAQRGTATTKTIKTGNSGAISKTLNLYSNTTDGFAYYPWKYDDEEPRVINRPFYDADALLPVHVKDMEIKDQRNFQNWFNFHRSRMLVAKGALRNVLENSNNMRIGFAPLSEDNPHYEVADMDVEIDDMSGDKYKLTAVMDSIDFKNDTQLRQALNDVGQYFSASSTDNKFGAGKHPYLMSDATTVAPAAACQQNYAILFTDGYWNGSFSGSDWDSDGSSGFDNLKYASFADKVKKSSPTLADVAMHYYERDLMSPTPELELKDSVLISLADRYPHTDSPGAVELSPFDASQRTMHQNMKTYTIAFGLGDGTDEMPTVLDTEFDWLNPFDATKPENKRQDLVHAAYNGRGEFYSANNYDELINSFRSSFNSIILNYRIGSAGVAFNSQELKTGTYIFRAFYNPETYEGDLVAVAFDSEGNPQLNTPVWSAAEQIEDQLCSDPSDPLNCDSSTRLVVTYDPYLKTGELFNHANLNNPSPEVLPGNPDQLGWFEKTPPKNLAGNGVLVDSYGNGDEYWTDERIRYLLGERDQEGKLQDDGGLRRRTGLLGDFANSTPRYVGVPQARRRGYAPYPVDPNYLTSESKNYSTFKITYKDRDELVYVGANDGMLHAFDANSGREAFAYVPNLVMDDLYEYTLPSYLHKMSVDGSPGINDVFIDDGRVNNERWRTMLVGGLRSGGKGYYALDITKPSTFNSTEMAANVLWEFSDINDSRLGYTFSTPNLVMSNATATYTSTTSTGSEVVTYNRWVALFGNGYNQTATNGVSGLFTLFLDQSGDTTWDSGDWRFLSTGVDSTGLTFPNGMSTPRAVDIDNNGSVDYVYAGDLAGNLYRFDLTSSDPSLWRVDPILFKGSVTKPITVQPIVMSRGANEGQVIVVSTGSWMTEQDRTSTATQSIYGIWDPLQDSWGTGPSAIATGWGPEITPTNLTAQSFTNVGTKFNGTDITYRTLSANDVVYNHAKNARKMGWKIDLNLEFPGERAIRNLLIKEGVLFGSTIIPQSNQACMNGPGGYLFSIDALTGGSVVGGPSFDLNNDGKFDELDVVEVAGTGTDYQDYAAAIRIEGGLPSDIAVIDGGKNDGSKVCYQTSTGDLVCTTVNVGSSYPEGRLSWKELSY